jgi:hypothetical protein
VNETESGGRVQEWVLALAVFNIQIILLNIHLCKPLDINISIVSYYYYYYFLWLCSPARAIASSFTRFLDYTQRRATVGGTHLDE